MRPLDALAEKLKESRERFQLLKIKGKDAVIVACGYNYPSHIREIVEQAASETKVNVELQSHIGGGIPVSWIERMQSLNGYTKFTW